MTPWHLSNGSGRLSNGLPEDQRDMWPDGTTISIRSGMSMRNEIAEMRMLPDRQDESSSVNIEQFKQRRNCRFYRSWQSAKTALHSTWTTYDRCHQTPHHPYLPLVAQSLTMLMSKTHASHSLTANSSLVRPSVIKLMQDWVASQGRSRIDNHSDLCSQTLIVLQNLRLCPRMARMSTKCRGPR